MRTNNDFYPISEIIKRATQRGVDFGSGNPENRIRYYIRFGLLPHAKRKAFNGTPPGAAFKLDVIDRLVQIDRLSKKGKSVTEQKILLQNQTQVKKSSKQTDVQETKLVNQPVVKPNWVPRIAIGLTVLILFLLLGSLFANQVQTNQNVLGVGTKNENGFVRVAKAIVSPLSYLNLGILKVVKTGDSLDPLGLTNISDYIKKDGDNLTFINKIDADLVNTKSINGYQINNKENSFVTLNSEGDLEIPGEIKTQIDWSWIKNKPDLAGSVNLVAGSNIRISKNSLTGAFTISSTATSTVISTGGGGPAVGGNADTLDSLDSVSFLRSDTSTTFSSGTFTLGTGTTLSIVGTFTCSNCVNDSAVSDSITIGAGSSVAAGAINSGTLSDLILSSNVTLQGNSFNGASQLVQLNGSGNLVLTGDITGGATGNVGYWNRTGTTLSPLNGDDLISLSTVPQGSSGLSITTANISGGTTNGELITLGTTATGTHNGLSISAGSASSGTLNGINIGTVSGAGTKNALNIGTGWNNLLYSTVFVVNGSGKVSVLAGQGLDTLSAGTLDLGVTTANQINIGTTGNAPITTGTGLLTAGGNFQVSGNSTAIGSTATIDAKYLLNLAGINSSNAACGAATVSTGVGCSGLRIAPTFSTITGTNYAHGVQIRPEYSGAGSSLAISDITLNAPANTGSGSIDTGIGIYFPSDFTSAGTNYFIFQNASAASTATNVLGAKTRIGSSSAPTNALDVSGNLNVIGKAAFGSGSSISTDKLFYFKENQSLDSGFTYGFYNDLTFNGSISAGFHYMYGFYNNATFAATGSGTNLFYGMRTIVSTGATAPAAAYGLAVDASFTTAPTDSTFGIILGNFGKTGSATTYGLHIGSQTGSTTNWGIYDTGTTHNNYFGAATSAFGDNVLSANEKTHKVFVKGSLCVQDTTDCPTSAGGGRIYYDVSTAVFDLAESFPTQENLEAGDVVTISPKSSASKNYVVAARKPYDEMLIGIVSADPSITFGSKGDSGVVLGQLGDNRPAGFVPISLAGRVPVKVSTENGSILVGDPLTSSSIPGVAMKATKSGATIGKALESYSANGVGKILVLVSTGWYSPPLTSTLANQNLTNVHLTSLTTASITLGENQIKLNSNGEIAFEGIININGDVRISKTLFADKIETNQLKVAKLNLDTSSDSSGSATISIGVTKIEIKTSSITASSQVLVTPTSFTDDRALVVTQKSAGNSFTVEITQPVNHPITFDWWVVN